MYRINRLFLVVLLGLLAIVPVALAQSQARSLEAAESFIALDEKDLDESIAALLTAVLFQSNDQGETAWAWRLWSNWAMQRKQYESAFVAGFWALRFDLDDKVRSDLRVAAKLAVEKSSALTPIKEKLSSLVDAEPPQGNGFQRELSALATLEALEYPKLYPAMTEVARLLALRHLQAAETPGLWLRISRLEEGQGREWEALEAVVMVVHAPGQSGLAGEAKLRSAELFSGPLKKYDLAAEAYREILSAEAESGLWPEARWQMAVLRDEREKLPEAAVEAYKAFIDSHPDDERVAQAWLRIADLQINRLKAPEAGIEAYGRLLKATADDALQAQAWVAVAETYENKVKDYAKAIEANLAFVQALPQHELAAERLYKAGRLAEDKLKDLSQAKTLYQRVVDEYTTQKPADDARVRIKSIEKKQGE